MFSVPRVARLFLILTALLAIPSLYLFYPGPRPAALQKFGWDVGGIDGEHFRTPAEILEANSNQQDHQVTPEQAAVEIEDEEQRALIDGESVNHGSGGAAPEHVGESGGDVRKGSGGGGGPADDSFDHEKHREVSGGKEEQHAMGAHGGEEIGKVIMPHLGNATAK